MAEQTYHYSKRILDYVKKYKLDAWMREDAIGEFRLEVTGFIEKMIVAHGPVEADLRAFAKQKGLTVRN